MNTLDFETAILINCYISPVFCFGYTLPNILSYKVIDIKGWDFYFLCWIGSSFNKEYRLMFHKLHMEIACNDILESPIGVGWFASASSSNENKILVLRARKIDQASWITHIWRFPVQMSHELICSWAAAGSIRLCLMKLMLKISVGSSRNQSHSSNLIIII